MTSGHLLEMFCLRRPGIQYLLPLLFMSKSTLVMSPCNVYHGYSYQMIWTSFTTTFSQWECRSFVHVEQIRPYYIYNVSCHAVYFIMAMNRKITMRRYRFTEAMKKSEWILKILITIWNIFANTTIIRDIFIYDCLWVEIWLWAINCPWY